MSALRAALLAVLLVLVGCGDDDSDDVTSETEPTSEDASAGDDSSTDDLDDTTTTAADGDGDDAGTADDGVPVTSASSDLGEILVDADGFTVYGFTNDADGTPTCTDGCADTWPPLFVDSQDLPEGLDASVFSVVEHPSGQFQLRAGDWPLYLYAADSEPGDATGQGVGGVWFVVDPQGQLIME